MGRVAVVQGSEARLYSFSLQLEFHWPLAMRPVFLYQQEAAALPCAGGLTISAGSVVSWEERVTEFAVVDQIGQLRDYRGPPKVGDTTRSDFGGNRVYQGDLIALPKDNGGWYKVKWPGNDKADLTHAEYMQVAKQEVSCSLLFASCFPPP